MMNSKMMASGGAMKSKMMASGGAMKTKMMASGGAMPMKDGKPAFLNDGKGMAKGGMTKMADGGSSDGRGIVKTPGDKKLNSPGSYATKILPSSMKPLTKNNQESAYGGLGQKSGGMMGGGGMHKMPNGKMMKDSAMAKGGMPPALAKHAAMKASKAHSGLKSGGMAKMMTSGGSASKRADGIAVKGKTKGMMMAKGGTAKKYC